MKTLIKTKIVLDSQSRIVTYMWKKVFLCFGYWDMYGCTSDLKNIDKITDNNISKIFYDKFIK